ncbi:hypothetical protein SynBIOSE41_02757 [Synechococcus sp. BIOS-E4-1]|nr:hypothetical protein SynBIOSE41_02757 [Synechococcus sp. BIOS-E4-1]
MLRYELVQTVTRLENVTIMSSYDGDTSSSSDDELCMQEKYATGNGRQSPFRD